MGGPLGAGDGVGLGLEGVVLGYFYGLEGLRVSFWGLGEGVLLGLGKILWGLGEGGVLLRLGLYFGGWGEGPIGAGWPFWGLGVFLVRLGGHFGVSPPRMTSYGSILMSPIPPWCRFRLFPPPPFLLWGCSEAPHPATLPVFPPQPESRRRHSADSAYGSTGAGSTPGNGTPEPPTGGYGSFPPPGTPYSTRGAAYTQDPTYAGR